jgi:hypothetical protein
MSTPYDDERERGPQAADDGFPGHCTYCGVPCETCAGQADQRVAPDDY